MSGQINIKGHHSIWGVSDVQRVLSGADPQPAETLRQPDRFNLTMPTAAVLQTRVLVEEVAQGIREMQAPREGEAPSEIAQVLEALATLLDGQQEIWRELVALRQEVAQLRTSPPASDPAPAPPEQEAPPGPEDDEP